MDIIKSNERTQKVSINGTFSKEQNLEFGVPQSSVLGAMMYVMYVYDLSKTIGQHNVKYQMYIYQQ